MHLVLSILISLLAGNVLLVQAQGLPHHQDTRDLLPGTHVLKLSKRGGVAIFTDPNGVFNRAAGMIDQGSASDKSITTLQNAYTNLNCQFQHFTNPITGQHGRNLSFVAAAYAAAQAYLKAHNQTVANVTGLLNTTGSLLPLTSLNATNATTTLNGTAAWPLASISASIASPSVSSSLTSPLPSAGPPGILGTVEFASNATDAAFDVHSEVAHAIDGTVQVKRLERRSKGKVVPAARRGSIGHRGQATKSTHKSTPVVHHHTSTKSAKDHSATPLHSQAHGETEAVPLQKTTVTDLVAFLNGNMWAGGVSIGTPAQKLTVTFDTGSSDLVVTSNNCKLAACQNKAAYANSASKTARSLGSSFTDTYGDGSVTSGNVFSDVVTVGDLSVKAQAVNSATTISGILANIPTDGLLGLAYPYLSSTGRPGFFSNLVASNVLAAPMFGLRYSLSGDSELYLGGIDSQQYTGQIEWHSVLPYVANGKAVLAYWVVGGGNAIVNGKSVVSNKELIIDSGTSLMYAPPKDAATFYKAIPGSGPCTTGVCAGATDLYQFPCTSSTSAPNVAFSVGGGRQIALGSTFNLGLVATGSKYCVGALISGAMGPTGSEWLMGAAFLQHTYAAFDMGNHKIGFAALS